jgi:hypothetical protein
MERWQPLADRIPVDMRRLATQLRRMKDRSGLTVPALAARTAQSAESWERAFAGRHLPPLDAVEVLAQASGADYDRIGALWKLAEKSASGPGDRGRGKPVPYPDPLDPLGQEEGLPRRGHRMLLLSTLGVLAVAALVAVLLTAGPSTGRVPPGTAGPSAPGGLTPGGTAGASGGSPAGGGSSGGATGGTGGGSGGTTAYAGGNPTGGASAGDRPSPAMGSLSPSPAPPATPGSGAATTAPPPPDSGGTAGTTPAPPATSAGGDGPGKPSTGPSSTSPSPSASSSQLCLGLILLGVCIG